jgi:multidrug efflux pump subunit AcrA (membrane-fusion protein)
VVTYTVIVDAPNPDEKLFPGMTASIRINIQSEEGILVPMEAVHVEMHGGASLRVKSNGKIEERNVQTGISDGVSIAVRSGIAEGEEVIVSEKGK